MMIVSVLYLLWVKGTKSIKVVNVKSAVIEEALNQPDFTNATCNTIKRFDQQCKFGLCFSFVEHILLLEFLCPWESWCFMLLELIL